MLKHWFGNAFDFDNDGKMDNFEKRAEFTAFSDEIRMQEGIQTGLPDMSSEQLAELAAKAGIDPSGFGL